MFDSKHSHSFLKQSYNKNTTKLTNSFECKPYWSLLWSAAVMIKWSVVVILNWIALHTQRENAVMQMNHNSKSIKKIPKQSFLSAIDLKSVSILWLWFWNNILILFWNIMTICMSHNMLLLLVLLLLLLLESQCDIWWIQTAVQGAAQ